MGVGDGASLKVDPDLLSRLGNQLQTAAMDLPDAPAPFVVSGTDPVSLAIAGRLPDVEGGIQQALPQVKADATATASNVVSAAGMYQRTDEQLAAKYEMHQFDQAGAPGSRGGGADSMSQMMSMPMHMAGQAAQLPAQVMGAVAAAPQAVMQGVQQVGQMAGGMGRADGSSAGRSSPLAEPGSEQQDRRDDGQTGADDEPTKQESQRGAASGVPHSERAPDSTLNGSPAATPDPRSNL